MRVLVLSHLFPNDHESAAGIFVLEQMRALRDLGVRTVVLSPTPWVPTFLRGRSRFQKYLSVPKRTVMDGFDVSYPRVLTFPGGRFFALSGWLFYLACRRFLRQSLRTEPIDLIHAHTIIPDGFAAVLLGREFNLPVVCTIHGSDVNLYPWRSRLSFWSVRWALRKADRLIAVSQRLKNKALTIAGLRDIALAQNGADRGLFKAVYKWEARATLGLPIDKKILLYVGNLYEVKGVTFLLQAVRQLARSDVALYLVGTGDLQDRLMKEAAEAGIQPACFFVGQQPHSRIPLWLSAADCLVLPSLSEGLPTILCEAMHCKTPIVATDVGGVSEIVKHRSTGLLVPSGDPAALAAAIAEQLANSSLRAAMVDRASMLAEQDLTWRANALKTMPVYESAVSLQPTPCLEAAVTACSAEPPRH